MSLDIDRLVAGGESETAEFTGPRASLEALARNVCGLLNQRGGVLLWGVTDTRKVVGVPDANRRAQDLNDYIVQHLRPRPLVSVSAEPVDDHGTAVVVVDVPPGSDKPYSVSREIWIRIASQTLRATDSKSAELVERKATRLERWEREPTPGFTISDCDPNELARARVEIEKTGRFGGSVPVSDEDLLRYFSLLHAGQLTNACLVLFARKPRAWSPNLTLRITSYAKTGHDPIISDIVLEGPAVDMLREGIAIIQQRTGFMSRVSRGKPEREDRPAYPLFTLREGLVNAIVHRDYAALGDVRVEIHPDSLLIQNPGALPGGWTIDDLRTEHTSQPVNPDIARVFFLRGWMEQLGTGTQKVIAEARRVGARTPSWTAGKGTVALRMFPAPTVAALAGRQEQFLRRQRPDEEFKVRDYAGSARVSERQGRRDLTEMEELGVIERRGKGPATSYRLRAESGNSSFTGGAPKPTRPKRQ